MKRMYEHLDPHYLRSQLVAIRETAESITLPGSWKVDIECTAEHGICLRVVDPVGVCNTTGYEMPWKGRRWSLSIHMTAGEIVQTAFKALLTAIEHEAREQFKYKGVAVLAPHFDVDALVANADELQRGRA